MKESTIRAKIMALENAAEFIRSHGEEGGIDDDTFEDFTLNEYRRQAKIIYKKLIKQSEKLNQSLKHKDNG